MIIEKMKNRESNIELLRLICMIFILLNHFLYHGLKSVGSYEGSIISDSGLFFRSFFIIAVNSFILISGYFSIKIKWKSFFHLYLMCAFYDVICTIIFQENLSVKYIIHSLLPFSHTNLWFVRCYFYLFLLSPMLNKVSDHCSKKEFIFLLLIWSVLTFYFGFLWKGTFNSNGYNIMNFMFLYLIGRFIDLHTKSIKHMNIKYLLVYLLCSFIIGLIALFIFHLGYNQKWISHLAYSYHSPIVVVSSVAFFLFFRSLNFYNKIVNWGASSAFAIYLIHENSHISNFLYKYIYEIGQNVENQIYLFVYLFIIAIVIMIICIFIDKLRIIIISPLEKFLNNINWSIFTNKIINKLTDVIK